MTGVGNRTHRWRRSLQGRFREGPRLPKPQFDRRLARLDRVARLKDAGMRRAIHQFPMVFIFAAAVAGVLIGGLLPVYAWFVIFAVFAVRAFFRASEKTALVLVLLAVPFFAGQRALTDRQYESASVLQTAAESSRPAIVVATIDEQANLRRHPAADLPGRRTQTPWQTRFAVTVQQARIGRQMKPINGRLLVVADGDHSSLRPGEQVEIYGTMRGLYGPTNPGQQDMRTIYRRKGLHGRIDVDSGTQIVVQQSSSSWFFRPVAWFAQRSRELLLKHTTPEAGPLAIALVIGQRDFVQPDTRDQLLVTGTAHLLSVSGMHLAIIVMLVKFVVMLMRLRQSFQFICILVVCAAYVAITGGRPPVMRAALLIAVLLAAIWLRRPSQPLNTLAFAGLILVFYNPINATAVGVQLSFLAVATLLLCGQRSQSGPKQIEQARQREERLQRLSDSSRPLALRVLRSGWSGLRQLTWFSACVTAMSLPLVWYHFNVVSPVSVATNVCLSPLLVFALGSGVATVFGGFLFAPLGDLFGAICSACLWSMHGIITFASEIPAGHYWLPSPPVIWIVVFYAVMACLMFGGRRWCWPRRLWIFAWSAVAYLIATSPAPLPSDTIEATFVDVGHGTSVVLRLDEDNVWLYDCGRLANSTGSSRDIESVLWSLGVTNLNGIFLSHADSDHYNALPGVLKRFAVEEIVTPPGMLNEDEAGALNAARTAIARYGVPVREIAAGKTLDSGQHKLQVLHPPTGGVDGNDNANSLVLNIPHKQIALLLPGDLEPPGTQVLINQPRPAPGGVLMAPHHGSLTMDSESILRWARPKETVVSGGKRARRPEVTEMLSVSGSGVHVTANSGAIRVRINAQGETEIRTWKDSQW